jgi:ubiquinone biosynthesis protein UbiJ
MLAELLFRPFEALLNRGLGQSEIARLVASRLEGRTLALGIDATPFDLRLRVSGGRIAVSLPDGSAADASISGTPLALGRLLGKDPQGAVRDGSVKMSGDVEIAGQFEELLRLASPDLGQELARLVGEPAAREFGSARRAFAEWRETAGADVARGVAEYLQKDSQMLPPGTEVHEFARQVDEFVNGVERAEARVRRLKENKP